MDLFVDTGVWSLALRRDVSAAEPAVERLRDALETGEGVFTTGLVLQELLQGFHGPKARDAIVERFSALPMLVPDRSDHVEAAEIRAAFEIAAQRCDVTVDRSCYCRVGNPAES